MTGTPADVAQLIKNELKVRAASSFPELAVRLELPSDWSLHSAPVLMVADDGGTVQYPVLTSTTVRVTTWTSGRNRTYADWALGQLLGSRIPGVALIRGGGAILDARDPKTRGDLASFTVRARARLR